MSKNLTSKCPMKSMAFPWLFFGFSMDFPGFSMCFPWVFHVFSIVPWNFPVVFPAVFSTSSTTPWRAAWACYGQLWIQRRRTSWWRPCDVGGVVLGLPCGFLMVFVGWNLTNKNGLYFMIFMGISMGFEFFRAILEIQGIWTGYESDMNGTQWCNWWDIALLRCHETWRSAEKLAT